MPDTYWWLVAVLMAVGAPLTIVGLHRESTGYVTAGLVVLTWALPLLVIGAVTEWTS